MKLKIETLRNSILTLLIVFSIGNFDVKAQDGEKLFKANCASCHKVDKKLIGPALAGVETRWESQENLISWIRNAPEYLKTGDPYATALYEEYNKTPMTAFPQLSDDDVFAILKYIDDFKVDDKGVPTGEPGVEGTPGAGFDPLWVLLPIAIIFLILAFLLSKVIGSLVSTAVEKDPSNQGMVPKVISLSDRFKLFLKHRLTIAVIVITVLCFVFSALWDGATSLGRQQGYMPVQPIKFSHELHAGINKIECRYCHLGVEKGKSAVIPSLNICMNCHMAVAEGPVTGTEEIAKIYDAVGWDAENRQYIDNHEQKQVEWVRVHNLPDHVYFNHSQHVKVGGIECQQCHGPVEEMEELQQYAPLSMGWCINCHRETKVNFTDNVYYSTYEDLHEKLKSGEIEHVTVEGIGGTECQKCHY